MKIEINNKTYEAAEGETLIEVAQRNGIDIPSLCYSKGAIHKASCMVCAVRNADNGQVIPSCSTLATEGVRIDAESEEVLNIRKLSLELLLSDHRADCEARCRVACPAGFDVARMNRLYDAESYDEALEHLRDGLVIPATLCYLCPAPCEKICRRMDIDRPVEIREIKKELVSRTDLAKIAPVKSNGVKVAILGSDPAALAAAYVLRKAGYDCTVFEKGEKILHPHVESEKVPAEVIGLEINVLISMGVRFEINCGNPDLKSFDKVISTTGETAEGWITLTTKVKQPARLVAEGKRLAMGVISPEYKEVQEFNSTYSRFTEEEKTMITVPDAASGCLYCDCDSKDDCRLRDAATLCGVKSSRYGVDTTSLALQKQDIDREMVFESAKCVRCGLCVYNSRDAFTFNGRGFPMKVVMPAQSEANCDRSLAELCPTGALHL